MAIQKKMTLEQLFRELKFPGFTLSCQQKIGEQLNVVSLRHDESGAIVTRTFSDYSILEEKPEKVVSVAREIVTMLFEEYREKFLSEDMSTLSQEFAVFYTKQDHDKGEMW